MNTNVQDNATGTRRSPGKLLKPKKVRKLFVQIQEDGKIKNGLALITNAPAPDKPVH